jgi:hypothetical protein
MAAVVDTGKTPRRWLDLVLPGRIESRRAATDLGLFAPWSDKILIRTFLYDLNLQPWAIALLAGIYWLAPLSFAAWDRTLLRSDDAVRLIAALTDFGLPPNVSNALVRVPFGDGVAANALPYLRDITHLLFTVVLCFGAAICAMTLKGFNRTIAELHKRGIPRAKAALVQRIYNAYRGHAFAPRYVVMSALFAAIAACLFIYFHRWSAHTEWWGHSTYGIAGLVFAPMVGLMVFGFVWGAVLLMHGSLMLARVMSLPVELKPFHRDGCNGLGPLGRQIFLLWWNAFFGSAAIYVTLKYGYLGVEHTPVVWALAMIGTLTVPVIAVLPLLASLRSVKKAQNAAIDRLSTFLDDHLGAAGAAVKAGDLTEAGRIVSEIGEARNLFEIYKTTNVWPFNPKALTFIVAATAVQVLLTTHQVLSLIPH